MNKYLAITTNCDALPSFLNSDIPNGVRMISPPLHQTRGGFDINVAVNFDIKFTIDLTKITALVFASWVIKKSLSMKGRHYINIKGNQIPVNDSKAVELITKEIEDKQNG